MTDVDNKAPVRYFGTAASHWMARVQNVVESTLIEIPTPRRRRWNSNVHT